MEFLSALVLRIRAIDLDLLKYGIHIIKSALSQLRLRLFDRSLVFLSDAGTLRSFLFEHLLSLPCEIGRWLGYCLGWLLFRSVGLR